MGSNPQTIFVDIYLSLVILGLDETSANANLGL